MRVPIASPSRILVVETDPGLQETLKVILSEAGYEPHLVASLDDARARMATMAYGLVLADLFDSANPQTLLPASVLQSRAQPSPSPLCLVTTQPCSEEEARAAGYAFVVRMPFDLAAFLTQVAAAIHVPPPEELPKEPLQPRLAGCRGTGSGTTAEDQLMAAASLVRAQAAEVRAWARERLAYMRVAQAEALDVREQAASARRRAELARVQALGVYVATLEAWTRTEEVQIMSKAASEAARALLTPRAS